MATEAPPRPPLPKQPAPPAPEPAPRQRLRIGWRWIAFGIALLAINYYAGSRAMHSQPRVRVPYSPFFLRQVTEGHVAGITSKGTAIQGTFTRPERIEAPIAAPPNPAAGV